MTPYLERRSLYGPLIKTPPEEGLGLVVVIPSFDEPDLLSALEALWAAEPPNVAVEVIVVVNGSADAKEEIKSRNRHSLEQARNWAEGHQRKGFRCFPIHVPGLDPRHAGVGLARKIGMDEACRRLERVGRPKGVIACFDADSRCDTNYLTELESWFRTRPHLELASIHFEHPLEGKDFPEEVYQAITRYELHLRYFIRAQAWAGFPHAFHTVGSSMAVRADAYQRQGGMNRRQAGEDFYFLHKFSPLGTVGRLQSTRVIPSPRPSQRVPFGTGREVTVALGGSGERLTYALRTFEDLQPFFRDLPAFWTEAPLPDHFSKALNDFLESSGWREKLEEARTHCGSQACFVRRFLRWFNAFRLMKFAHFARAQYYPEVPVTAAARQLLLKTGRYEGEVKAPDLLRVYRNWERSLPDAR